MTDRLTPETFEMTVGGSGGCWVRLGNSQVKWVLHRAMFEDPKQMVLRVCGPFVASVKEFSEILAETTDFEAFSSAAHLDNDFAHNVVADHSCLWRTIPAIYWKQVIFFCKQVFFWCKQVINKNLFTRQKWPVCKSFSCVGKLF